MSGGYHDPLCGEAKTAQEASHSGRSMENAVFFMGYPWHKA
jgi:hypothetical protein